MPLGTIHTEVKVEIVRAENRRLRIGKVEVTIDPNLSESERENARRCLDLFEDFCTVTQNVRKGIDVAVSVKGFAGVNGRPGFMTSGRFPARPPGGRPGRSPRP